MTPQRFDELRANAYSDDSIPLLSNGDLIECLDEIARLAAMVYVPGGWHCPKCKFHLVSSVLYAKTGNVGVNRQTPDSCPNDGTPMEPDTWQADAMASRLGDVGITDDLNATNGYHYRSTCVSGVLNGPAGPIKLEPAGLLENIEMIERK